MKTHRIIFTALFLIISFSGYCQNKKKTSSKSKKIDSITVNMKKTSGLITTYFSKEKEKWMLVSYFISHKILVMTWKFVGILEEKKSLLSKLLTILICSLNLKKMGLLKKTN